MNKKDGLIAVVLIVGLAFAGFAMAEEQTQGQMRNGFDPAIREQIEDAIANEDYTAWLNIHEENNFLGGRMTSLITEENFSLLNELHTARENKDFERIKEIREELGFPEKGPRGRMGFQKGNFEGKRNFERGSFEGKRLMRGNCPLVE